MIQNSSLTQNEWITDPLTEDPQNLPEPLGWTLLIRPYPVKSDEKKSTIILPGDEIDRLNYVTCVGRVIAVGPCCWTRSEHRDKDGERFDWVEVGDFVAYPRHVGAKHKFKGVSYMVLVDDEITQKLPDPQVFDDDYYTLDIPEEHLTKYNSIHSKGDK